MGLSRYNFVKKLNFKGKTIVGTNSISAKIYNAVDNGRIKYESHVLAEGERLDILSGVVYGDAGYWWVIAAASGIGWPLQAPPGTFIKVPSNLNDVFGIIS
jgi:hypothetical protein